MKVRLLSESTARWLEGGLDEPERRVKKAKLRNLLGPR